MPAATGLSTVPLALGATPSLLTLLPPPPLPPLPLLQPPPAPSPFAPLTVAVLLVMKLVMRVACLVGIFDRSIRSQVVVVVGEIP